MKIQFVRQYIKKETRNPVFVYLVSGSPEEMKSYQEIQGENLVVDNGNHLYFTSIYAGDEADLIVTADGRLSVDRSEITKAQSLINGLEGPLKDEMVKLLAAKLLGDFSKK